MTVNEVINDLLAIPAGLRATEAKGAWLKPGAVGYEADPGTLVDVHFDGTNVYFRVGTDLETPELRKRIADEKEYRDRKL